MSERVPLEQLRLEPMANGWQCLLLTEQVGWGAFPRYARKIAKLLNAHLGREVEGADVRMRALRISGHPFWLVYDDYPFGITLEPTSSDAAGYVEQVRDALARHGGDQP